MWYVQDMSRTDKDMSLDKSSVLSKWSFFGHPLWGLSQLSNLQIPLNYHRWLTKSIIWNETVCYQKRYSIVYTLLATININKFMQWEIQPFFSLFYTFMNSIYVKCPSVPRQVSKVLKRARQICDMSRTCPGQIRTCPWTSPASCLNGAFLDILFEDFPN